MSIPSHPFDLAALSARLLGLPRLESIEGAVPTGPRASVAAILREGREHGAEVLLIRRADRLGDPWSGHMAFPGGRRDEADRSPESTAVREAREEVGIDLDAHGTLLARLPDVPATARGRRTGLVIAPFVFALRADLPLTFAPDEVAEALWAPLAPLARGEGAGTMPYEHEGQTIELPCLRVEGRVVWGLTYQMLTMLFTALAAP